MPEGPEAHVMAADLTAFFGLSGTSPSANGKPRHFLEAVEFLTSAKNFAPGVFRYDLVERKHLPLLGVAAVGKKVIFDLGTVFLVSFLGMGGLWQLKPTSHARLKLTFSDQVLYFNDTRGTGRVVAWTDLDAALKDVGPDLLLGGEVTYEIWARALKRNEAVCMTLVEPTRVSGIGNYLRADIMYQARVSPFTRGVDLTEVQLRSLLVTAREIMKRSVEAGGHSLRDYFRLDGSPGNYRPLIYSRKECPEGHKASSFKDKKGRTCHFCPQCQK